MKFEFYYGDLMGLPVNENYMVIRWKHPDVKVLFSFAQLGSKAINLHMATKNATFEQSNEAVMDFMDFVNTYMYGIEKVVGFVRIPKIASRIAKLGFKLVGKVPLNNKMYLIYEYDLKGEK